MNVNCFNWNYIVPKQYIWESTCGYHAIRNSIIMYTILISINKYNNRKEYINQISKNVNFNNLLSEQELNYEIKKYKKILNKKADINSDDIKTIFNIIQPSFPINIIYDFKNHNLKLLNNDIKVLIVYRQKMHFSRHWIPVIIQKMNNNINIHIIDSFESTWYGEEVINNIINSIKKDNDYNLIIKCKDNNINNFLSMSLNKLFDLILLISFIFFITYSTYHN